MVLYGGMTILVLSTIVHYYTSSHLTAVTALKSLDDEFESVSASLKVPFYVTFFRVTVPVCLPAILDIARYLFINAMVTLSAVVFLYSPDTRLASVAIVNLDEAGEIGPGRGDGDAHRRDVHRGVHRLRAAHAPPRATHAGVARAAGTLARFLKGLPMSNYSRDPILLTPGPLTTSLATKTAMLRDWGSWDAAFNAVTAAVRRKLMDVVGAPATHTCIPCRAAGRSPSRERSTPWCRATATCWCWSTGHTASAWRGSRR